MVSFYFRMRSGTLNFYYRDGDRGKAREILRTLLDKNPNYEKKAEVLKLLEG